MEAKDLILNGAQGSPREDLPNSPPEKHSPLHTPSRTLSSQQKYQIPRSLQPTIITPPSSSVPDDEYNDSNGAIAYPPDYHAVFLPSFAAEESYYQHHQHQDIFYQYDSELTSHHHLNSVGPTQQRPFSASSSSCSSTESDHPQHQNLHLQSVGNPYCGDSIHGQHFINCFNNNQLHAQSQTNVYGHDFKPTHPQSSAGYTSVIVDTQQYQLAHEYVH